MLKYKNPYLVNQSYKKNLRILRIIIFNFFLSISISAQIQVTPATDDPYNPINLIENVFLGDGVEILNINFKGAPVATGVFSSAIGDVNLERGIVISTGEANKVNAPNDSVIEESSSTSGDQEFDPDLEALVAPNNIRDVAVYEITFRPISDNLRFRYVFASEEYPEFVCGSFNDVFGFFISGPDPTGGDYVAKNIALVPELSDPTGLTFTDFPVFTNSINPGQIGSSSTEAGEDCTKENESLDFSDYYNDNIGSSSLIFDGYSDVFIAQADVIACEQYTIKLAIADVTDGSFNSAVFLEAKSFSSPTLSVGRGGDPTVDGSISEGCNEAIFRFKLPSVATQDTIIALNLITDSSLDLAENGVDYRIFPSANQLIVDAGSDEVELRIETILDNELENEESILLSYQKNICTIDTLRIVIRDRIIETLELEQPTEPYCTSGYTVQAEAPGGSSSTLTPFRSRQLINIEDANRSYSDSIRIDGVEPSILSEGLISKICIDSLEHRVPEDLDIYITSPGGQVLELSTDNGGIGQPNNTVFDKYVNTCFTIGATQNINNGDALAGQPFAGNPDYTGEFLPEGDWNDLFNGDNPVNGFWKLTVIDDSGNGDGSGGNSTDGNLRGWSIEFNSPYEVEYNWTLLDGTNDGSISDPSILNTTFTPIAEQTYVLEAIDSYGCSVRDTITVIPGEQILPPDNLRCTPGSNSILVNWDILDMPDGFEVFIGTDSMNIAESDWESVGLEVQENFLGLLPSTDYIIGVRSVGVGCVGDPLFIVCQTNSCTVPQITPLTRDPSSCRDDGEIIIVASGSNPFTYELNGQQTPDGIYTDLTDGSYLIKVTDATGCPDTIRIDLVKDSFRVEVTVEREIDCFGAMTGSLRAEPRPLPSQGGALPTNFEWSSGQNGFNEFSIFGLGADDYRVTITNDEGCTAIGEITLTQPPEFRSDVSAIATQLSCKDASDGTLNVPVFGGSPPYQFQWNDPLMQTDSVAIGLAAGDYTVIVSDSAGCQLPPITGTIAPNNGFSVLQETLRSPTCAGGNNGVASFSNRDGQDPLTWTWTNEAGDVVATNREATNLSAGKYDIEIRDANGCPEFTSIEITAPEPVVITEFTVNPTRCFDTAEGSISVTVAGGTGVFEAFEWNKQTSTDPVNGTAIGNTETAENLSRGFYNVRIMDTNQCPTDTTLEVSSPPAFSFSAEIDTVDCFGDASGGIIPTVTGSVGPYSYQWLSSTVLITDEAPTGLLSDEYDVIVTDAVGCTHIDTVFVPENRLIEPQLNVTEIACKGESTGDIEVFLSGGRPDFSYSWTKNGAPLAETTRKIENLEPGNYEVSILDVLGCPAEISHIITEPAAIFVVDVIADTICRDAFEPGRLTVEASGGVPGYSYEWGDGATTPTQDYFAGNYTVKVTDNAGCERNIETAIEEVRFFDISEALSQTAAKCNDEASGSATINLPEIDYIFGNENLVISNVLWSGFPDQNALTIENLTGGQEYKVQLTDKFGCTALDSLTIENPEEFGIALDTIMDVACFAEENGSININPINGEGPFEYLWSPSTNSQTVQNAIGLRRGTHEVTVTDNNDCKTSKSFLVQEPNLLVADGRAVKTFCFGDENGRVDLLVSGGTPDYFYNWSDGSQNANILDVGVGNFSVTITDQNDCQVIEEVEVEGPENPLDFEFEVIPPVCPGDNSGLIEVTATGGNGFYQYSYDDITFVQNPTLVGLVDGAYTITVKDRNGCSISKDTVVTNPDALTLSIGRDTIIPSGANLFVGTDLRRGDIPVGGEGLVFDWSINPPELDFSGFNEFIEIQNLNEDVIITLTVTDTLGCTVTAMRQVGIESILNNQVMVPTGFTPNGDGANDLLRVLGRDGITINSFKIFSRWGELVYFDSEFILDLDDDSKGWNGVFEGKPMNPNTFVWIVEATFEDGFQAVYKGNTQLIR